MAKHSYSNFKDLFPPVAPSSLFVKILHVRENHWVTVSNTKVPGDYIFQDCVYTHMTILHLSALIPRNKSAREKWHCTVCTPLLEV